MIQTFGAEKNYSEESELIKMQQELYSLFTFQKNINWKKLVILRSVVKDLRFCSIRNEQEPVKIYAQIRTVLCSLYLFNLPVQH